MSNLISEVEAMLEDMMKNLLIFILLLFFVAFGVMICYDVLMVI